MGGDNPFAKLEALRGLVPAGPAGNDGGKAASSDPKGAAKADKIPPRAVVRLEKKGRGGKEVTVVEKLELSPTDRETWCRRLKGAMGCGGTVDGDALVLQGDLRDRVAAWLTAAGVKKVSVG